MTDVQLFDRARIAVRVADLASAETRLTRSGAEMRGACPLCGVGAKSSSPPFLVKDDRWRCYSCGLGGDVTDLEFHLRGESLAAAAQRLVGADWMSQTSRPKPAVRARDDDRVDARRAELAAEMWDAGRTISGTLAERYLRDRCIAPAAIELTGAALRYNPFAKWGWDGAAKDWIKAPALVARTVDGDGATGGVHATYLARTGGGKTKLTPSRKMFGRQGVAWLIGPEGPGLDMTDLVVAEGIETTLSIVTLGLRAGKRLRACAALSLNRLQGGLMMDARGCADPYDPKPDPKRPAFIWPNPSAQPWGAVLIGIDRDMSPVKLRGRTGRGRECMFTLGAEDRARLCATLAVANWSATGAVARAIQPSPGRDFNDDLRIFVGKQ